MQITPQETNLLLTEPVMNLPNVQEHYDQIVFEEYDFASYLRCPGAFSVSTLVIPYLRESPRHIADSTPRNTAQPRHSFRTVSKQEGSRTLHHQNARS